MGSESRLGQRELRDVEVAGAKARLGVGQVQRPHLAERLVEAKLGELRQLGLALGLDPIIRVLQRSGASVADG